MESTSFLESCGYIATFMGTLLEGEISLVTSVLGAKMGYYNFFIAMIFAFLGAWVADWFKYLVGKTRGAKLLNKKPKLKAKIDKATALFDKNPYLILTFYKFLFGTTTILLILAGIKNISYWRFALHSGISVGLWVTVIGGLGYIFGEALIDNIKMLSEHGTEVLLGLATIALLYWFFKKRPFQKKCLEEIPEVEIS